MMKRSYLIFCLFFLAALSQGTSPLHAQNIRIGLFNEFAVQTYIFTPLSGRYLLTTDQSPPRELTPGMVLYISLLDDKLSLRDMQNSMLTVDSLQVVSSDSSVQFSLRPAFPAMDGRKYDGDVFFSPGMNRIQVVNSVPTDKYLAAVVESEGGASASLEFYKAQAVLCRTYAVSHLNRHAIDGFNLCDDVHCQAYKSRNSRNPQIMQAVVETHNEVAVYNDTVLITAAFHANCGGQTQNSENEWLQVVPYLRSVKDPYCTQSRNAKWELAIPREKWASYLRNNNIHIPDPAPDSIFTYRQDSRMRNYMSEGDSLSLKKIRTDWMLRSAYFSISDSGNNQVVLHGRGYGHGIGMCQQGAMNMALQGMDYKQILNFYFKNIKLVPYNGR
jgi:stage II sporulation protein D